MNNKLVKQEYQFVLFNPITGQNEEYDPASGFLPSDESDSVLGHLLRSVLGQSSPDFMKGGSTFCFVKERVWGKWRTVTLGIARCKPGERFSFKKGREIARRRAYGGPNAEIDDLFADTEGAPHTPHTPRTYWAVILDRSGITHPHVPVKVQCRDGQWLALDRRVGGQRSVNTGQLIPRKTPYPLKDDQFVLVRTEQVERFFADRGAAYITSDGQIVFYE